MYTSKKSSLKKFEISNIQKRNIKGRGEQKEFVEAHLCEIERKNLIKKGGNGSGDW